MKKIKNKKYIYISTDYGRHLCSFEPDEKRGFIVTVPGLRGVITWGGNMVDAKKMVREAIELCIESLTEKVIVPDMPDIKREAKMNISK